MRVCRKKSINDEISEGGMRVQRSYQNVTTSARGTHGHTQQREDLEVNLERHSFTFTSTASLPPLSTRADRFGGCIDPPQRAVHGGVAGRKKCAICFSYFADGPCVQQHSYSIRSHVGSEFIKVAGGSKAIGGQRCKKTSIYSTRHQEMSLP